MASGVGDEVTLRANREGFAKFQLRPRRLVDVSKVDMSTEILGVRYDSPIILAPVGGQSLPPRGESRSREPREPATTCRFFRPQTTTGVEDVTAARGAPIWFQLYASNSGRSPRRW